MSRFLGIVLQSLTVVTSPYCICLWILLLSVISWQGRISTLWVTFRLSKWHSYRIASPNSCDDWSSANTLMEDLSCTPCLGFRNFQAWNSCHWLITTISQQRGQEEEGAQCLFSSFDAPSLFFSLTSKNSKNGEIFLDGVGIFRRRVNFQTCLCPKSSSRGFFYKNFFCTSWENLFSADLSFEDRARVNEYFRFWVRIPG